MEYYVTLRCLAMPRSQICCQAAWQIPRTDICTMKSDKQIKSVIKSWCFPERIYLPKSVSAWFFPPAVIFVQMWGKKNPHWAILTLFILVPKCKFCCVNTSAWSQKTFPSVNCNPPQHYWALQILPPRTAGWKTLLIWFSAGQRGEWGCLAENLNNNTFHHGSTTILWWKGLCAPMTLRGMLLGEAPARFSQGNLV